MGADAVTVVSWVLPFVPLVIVVICFVGIHRSRKDAEARLARVRAEAARWERETAERRARRLPLDRHAVLGSASDTAEAAMRRLADSLATVDVAVRAAQTFGDTAVATRGWWWEEIDTTTHASNTRTYMTRRRPAEEPLMIRPTHFRVEVPSDGLVQCFVEATLTTSDVERLRRLVMDYPPHHTANVVVIDCGAVQYRMSVAELDYSHEPGNLLAVRMHGPLWSGVDTPGPSVPRPARAQVPPAPPAPKLGERAITFDPEES